MFIGELNLLRWAMSWAWDHNPGTQADKLHTWEQRFGQRMPLRELRSQRPMRPRGAPRRPCYRGVRW
jgi:hypothetical protein